MPCISQFYWISIYIYRNDHAPAHIHAIYWDFEAMFRIDNGEVIKWSIPRRATRLVQDRIELHRGGLEYNYQESQSANPNFIKIPGLN